MVADVQDKPRDLKMFLDPMRDPAWRGVRAEHLVDSGSRPKPPSKRDDKSIRKYRRFLMEWRKGGSTRRDKLFCEDPGLYFAHQFYQHPDREWRAIIEAKLLAREPDEYIAAEFSTCVEAINWYHELFFDVRNRLHSSMYITKTILGPQARRMTSFDDVITEQLRYLCYKNFAYFGGPVVLDTIITGFNSTGSFPTKPGQVDNWMDSAFKAIIKQRSNMTAQIFTVNKFNCMELMQMHVTLLGQAQAALAAGGGGAITDFHQNIEMFFDQMPLAIGAKSKVGRTAEMLQYESTGVEPRADELLELAEGNVPDPLKGKLEFSSVAKDADNEQTHGQEV